MGAWGVQTFENDDALDFAAELQESNSLKPLSTALEAIAPGKYLEAPDCTSALAAAEVVAALRGRPSPSLPDDLLTWVRSSHLKADDKLVAMARMAVHRIGASSELRELWEESKEFPAWERTIKDLETRLGAV